MSTALRLAFQTLQQEMEKLPPHSSKRARLLELINALKEELS
jgi:hypothetical protein